MDKDHSVVISKCPSNSVSLLFLDSAVFKTEQSFWTALFYMSQSVGVFFNELEKQNLLSLVLCTLQGVANITDCAMPCACSNICGGQKCAEFQCHGWKVTLTRIEDLYLCTHASSTDKQWKYLTCCCLGTEAYLCPASGHGPKSAFKGPPALA